MSAAIRVTMAAMVGAILFGFAGGPRSDVEAAGANLWSLTIRQFCGRATGSPASAALKVKFTLKNTGDREVAGELFVTKSGYNTTVSIGYEDLTVNRTVVLLPGESVTFTAFATGLNLSGNFRLSVGIRPGPETAAYDYDYTAAYAVPSAIPAC